MRPLCWGTISPLINRLPQKCLNCGYKVSCIKRKIIALECKHSSLENPSIRLGKIFGDMTKDRRMGKNLYWKDKETQEELEIYAVGFVYCSICTNIKSKRRIEEIVNRINPTGISSTWKISKENFRTGQPNPCPCEQKKGFKHFLLEC